MKKVHTGSVRSTKHTDIQAEPRRVAARQEGVVRNIGIKPTKKLPKQKNNFIG